MRISNAIAMFDRTFGTNHDRTCVIALWTHDWLRSFTDEELEELADNARSEKIYADREFGTTINRLLMRINDVKQERVRGHNTNTKTKDDTKGQLETTTCGDEVPRVQGRTERMGGCNRVETREHFIHRLSHTHAALVESEEESEDDREATQAEA